MTPSPRRTLAALAVVGLLSACAGYDQTYSGSTGYTSTYAGTTARPAYGSSPTYLPPNNYAATGGYYPSLGYVPPGYQAVVRTPGGEVITESQLERDRAAALDPRCRATPLHQDRPGGYAYDPWRGAPSC